MTKEEVADNIIEDLDEYATDYDHYEFGLPMMPEQREAMRAIIYNYLEQLTI